jgi:hypothetical protein
VYLFPLPAALIAAAPGVAAGLAAILARLAALIARALLKHPSHVAVIVPLWNYIGRTARRITRALDRVDLPRRARAPRLGRKPGKPPIQLPRQKAWLIATLRHEAAAFAGQIEHLLSEPEAQALFQASPTAQRALRPICHMLGVQLASLGIQPDALKRHPTPAKQGEPPRRQDAKPARSAPNPTQPNQPPAKNLGALASWCSTFPDNSQPDPRLTEARTANALANLCPRLRTRWPFNQHPRFRPA